jgi:transposase
MAGRGRPFVVVWDEDDSEEALRAAYRAERDVDVRQRVHALWLLRSGERRMDEVAALVGTTYRTVQRWVAWYRQGGLDAVRTHRMGGYGQPPRLTVEQQEHLAQEVATGRFRNAAAIRAWVAETFGVTYTEGGMDSLLERLECKPKVPRPLHEKANLADQETWNKGDSEKRSRPPASPYAMRWAGRTRCGSA